MSILRVCLYISVILHFILFLGNILSALILPFVVPWYVALPLCTFLVRLMVSRDRCPATDLENYIRLKIGLPKIAFVKNYIINPIKGSEIK